MASPLFVECYVIVCVLFHHIATGLALALPALVTPVITGNVTDIYATKEQASWFTACFGMTGPVSFIILPGILQLYGRRVTKILMNCFLFTGSVIIATAANVTWLVIGRSIQGVAFAGIVVCCIIVAEYSHPKRRGSFMALKIAGTCFGELLCHGLGQSLTWRQLAWLSTVPSALGAIGTLKWPESPAWLAYQGRYEDCKKAFEYIRGRDLEARKELTELISAQQELKRTCADYDNNISSVLKALRSKQFMKPLLPAIVLVMLLQASGTFYLIAYLIQIMTKMTGDKSNAFYFSIGFDILRTIAMLIVCFVIRLFNRRTLLFSCGYTACVLLGLVCVFNYLDSKGIIHCHWLSPVFMLLYIFVCTFGILSISIASKGELLPLQYRGIGSCVSGIFLSLSAAFVLKFTSTMLDKFDVHGMLAIYLVFCVILLTILYFTLPETKDKTLQNIENYYVSIKLPVDLEDRGEERVTKDSK